MSIETFDPLNRKIQVTTGHWNVHIVRNHPEMYQQERLLEKVLKNPYMICKDKTTNTEEDAEREQYYDLCRLPGFSTLVVLKAIVEFPSPKSLTTESTYTGAIVTAYHLAKLPEIEEESIRYVRK